MGAVASLLHLVLVDIVWVDECMAEGLRCYFISKGSREKLAEWYRTQVPWNFLGASRGPCPAPEGSWVDLDSRRKNKEFPQGWPTHPLLNVSDGVALTVMTVLVPSNVKAENRASLQGGLTHQVGDPLF